MGHAFITRSSFHQLLALLLSLPTAEPSVPEVSVTGDNMSPRWGAGGKPHAHRSSNDYLIRLFTLDLKEERGTKWRLLPICSAQGKKSRERERGESREERGAGARNGRSVNTTDEREEKGPEEREKGGEERRWGEKVGHKRAEEREKKRGGEIWGHTMSRARDWTNDWINEKKSCQRKNNRIKEEGDTDFSFFSSENIPDINHNLQRCIEHWQDKF